MPAAQPDDIALAALSKAAADPTPRPLHGTKAKPGVFTGKAQATLKAAELAKKHAWIERTGEFRGKGKSRAELWRITPAGIAHALSQAEVPSLLGDMLGALDDQARSLGALGEELARCREALVDQRAVVDRLRQRVEPPDVDAIVRRFAQSESTGGGAAPSSAWLDAAVRHLEKQGGKVTLGALYDAVARPRDVTIGAFHDGVRDLARSKRIRLRPWSQPLYQLREEQYALMWGQEIMFYAERA